MHGREGEERTRERGRHMWTGPTRVNSVLVGVLGAAAGDVSSSYCSVSTTNSFLKDGRRISIGDCALFKPPQDSPPFIGIIRWLTTGKENVLKLGVNWLYRPAEVKLGKGIHLEAAPNEVFYSFHKDEIPAASLLHPCKVAFLPKGVELPTGICSFVCRRVYDITNKCLWWLTDQDYINERQEEVDQLLCKTRIEMHVQQGGRSPKPMNGPTSTSQLKLGSDSVQNSASSFPSQVKGKKRERGDQGTEPIKRERSSKLDDCDSSHSRPESFWKSEIAKFTEKGGLVDSEGVEKLVQLMLPERNEKKIDLVGRSVLAGVIAATDKFDCLDQFVQLRGLPVFDEWLQEVHKGKIGDGSSHKDSDKCIEEFLLVLLRALDKLPVNLHALQMCNIGKSVNHLRTHKHLEIQKKARTLVDTWKKRVEAEMDARSGSNTAVSWAARPRLPEVSHGVNRHSGAASEIAMKSSVAQFSASKNTPVKIGQMETMAKSLAVSPGSMKPVPSSASAGNSTKEGQVRNTGVGGASDLPSIATRDEKSSSSSQSHNNSQSCSSDHAKNGGVSGKEDARSSTAVSMAANKTIGGSSRHRKSVNGFQGGGATGIQRDSGSSRNASLHRIQGAEKLSQSSLTCDKAVDVPIAEGNNHKLIVKIPNRGRSPAQSASGGSFEDPSVMNSRASSPVLSDKHEQLDRNLKEKNDVYRTNVVSDVNNESWQSNDFKEVLTGSDEGDGSPAIAPDEENCRPGDDQRKLADAPKAASSSSGNEHKTGKLHEGSFSSMNALIESCVKYSEVTAPMSVGDDVGMNLLATVAAGEMSKSDMASPKHSPQTNTTVVEHHCTSNDGRLKSSPGDNLPRDRRQSVDGVDDEHENRDSVIGSSLPKITEDKIISCLQEIPTEVRNGRSISSNMDVQKIVEPDLESNVKSEEILPATPVARSPRKTVEKTSMGADKATWEGKPDTKSDGICDTKENVDSCLRSENKFDDAGLEGGNEPVEGSLPCPSMEVDGQEMKPMNDELKIPAQADQKPPAVVHSVFAKGTVVDGLNPSPSDKDKASDIGGGEVKAEKADETDCRSQPTGKESTAPEIIVGSAVTYKKGESIEESLECSHSKEQHSSVPAVAKVSVISVQEAEQEVRSSGSKLIGSDAGEAEESTSGAGDAASLSAAGGSDIEAKVEFDLNEGFNADDGRYGEMSNLKAPECSTAIQLINPLPLPVSSASTGLPASITVASAAKRPFVPPEDLLKNRGELGWKGSAATSAFRPAEPRKTLETSAGTSTFLLDAAAVIKPSRPPLDFDLNVPDERILEDMASRGSVHGTVSVANLSNNLNLQHDEIVVSEPVRGSGGLDLDLNRVEEPNDVGNHLTSNGRRIDAHLQGVKSSSGAVLNGESTVRRDFDLNDGPLLDEVNAEVSPFSQHIRNNTPSQPSVSGLRLNNTEMGNFSSWFSQVNSYPAVAIQSILPERGEQPFPMVTPGGPQRILPPSGSTPFNPDVYRGPVLSSAPAVPFPASPFQYPVFPFGTNLPLPSATFSGGSSTYVDSSSGGRLCFPAVHSQVLAPAGAVPSHYTRPFVVSLQDNSNNSGSESSRKWVRQGLDLNAGPLGPDMEGKDETPSLASRQLSVANAQAFVEEQSRMYQVAGGGILKRKEPDNGWESYKQSSWQ
ncbi:conserved hypothetical protein [Ricinus communis]|uniref:BAH domain-containing protein n=1 Tax=Ricinus communis TaxID=3988 RepID=B9RB69_RICCO|nr:conserved hypothetical protein [Ricinus communis]|eukprot:XP_002511444.1 uncharacterized protein LOC8258104 isoform X1 [Ricinus communis]